MSNCTDKDEKESRRALSEQLEHRTLAMFHVGEYVFKKVQNNVVKGRNKEKYDSFIRDAERYNHSDNIVVKTAIGKKWAPRSSGYDYDYDASFFANLIYQNTIFPDGKIEAKSKDPCEFEYVIRCNGACYRGDTMNSWQTTVNNFIQEKTGIKRSVSLDHLINHPMEFPPYITHFLSTVYTIGNFIPVPVISDFNRRRYSLSDDYWDLTLLAIYCYYMGFGNSKEWGKLLEESEVWLGQKGEKNWDHFVEKNFLQDFVNQKAGGGYGLPKELWDGHFFGSHLPGNEKDFEQFFTNASAWILARGMRLVLALEKREALDKEMQNSTKEDK